MEKAPLLRNGAENAEKPEALKNASPSPVPLVESPVVDSVLDKVIAQPPAGSCPHQQPILSRPKVHDEIKPV